MPKDPTKHVDRYKIRGGQLNEFELHQSQEEYAKDKALTGKQLIPVKASKGTKGTKATKSTKATKTTKKRKAVTGASPKKLAARKTAKKTAQKK
jgi:hypothetical protein